MSSVKSNFSPSEITSHDGRGGDILKMGYLKKLKTMRKKFFVLRGESSEASARLEYYDSEKKWKSNNSPKRSISLKTCFNINRRLDTKQKHVIALYTKDDCFCVVLENEEEVEEWLRALLNLQHGEETTNGEKPKPTFEHVWQVTVQKKGLGSMKNILGPYHLCLTDKTLSLVKKGSSESKNESYEFSLMSIRRCGHSDCFFYMEVGRLACTGAGDLWMLTEDPNIAENMHAAILHAMSNNNGSKAPTYNNTKEEIKEKRTRSSSASFMYRWQNHSKSYYASEDGNRHVPTKSAGLSISETNSPSITTSDNQSIQIRDRSDSMPSRARTSSEGHNSAPPSGRSIHLVPGHFANRPFSMYSQGVSYTPPVGSSPVSPASGACSTDSAGSSLSMDDTESWAENTSSDGSFLPRYLHPLTPDEPVILEEEYAPWENKLEEKNDSQPMESLSLPIQTSSIQSSQRISQRTNKYLTSSSFKSNSPIQNSYMEMYSPCSSSPMDQGSSYIPMSPGGETGGHSQASSLTEDGYVPMAPPANDDGYVDMDPNPRNGSQNSEASPGSSCSLTSGTPSTDMRFSEYHLEKVTSYFSPCDEDERHPRAYSVGSRPDNKQICKEASNPGESCRVRAFSVGSRISPGLRLSWVPHLSQHCPSTSAAASAPHLSSSWSGVTPTTKYQTSTDLMEMDFSRNSLRSNKSISKKTISEKLPISSLATTTISTSTSSLSTSTASPSNAEGTLDTLFSQKDHPILSKETSSVIKSGPYVEMKAIDIRNSPPTKNWPNRSPKIQTAYVDMSISKTPPTKTPNTSSLENDYVQMTDYIIDSHPEENKSQDDYIEMSIKPDVNRTLPLDTPKVINPQDHYVEMNWKKFHDDYANTSQEDRIRNRKDKNRHSSQPIAIQSTCLGVASSRGRKRSTGTPPKPPPSFLALGVNNASPNSSPYNSLRHKPRENTSDANTPSGSTGIFPFSLNSPGSPIKPFIGYDTVRKCPVDATNGTVRISYLPTECSSTISNIGTPDSISSSELPTPVNNESLGEIAALGGDYVNCNPLTNKKIDSDYTYMKPIQTISNRKTNFFGYKYKTNLHNDLNAITLSSNESIPSSTLNTIITHITTSDSELKSCIPKGLTTNPILNNICSISDKKSYTTDSLTSPTQSISDVIVSPIESKKSVIPSMQSSSTSEVKTETENISSNIENIVDSHSSLDNSAIDHQFEKERNKRVSNSIPQNEEILNTSLIVSSFNPSLISPTKYTCSFMSHENKKLTNSNTLSCSSEGDNECFKLCQNQSYSILQGIDSSNENKLTEFGETNTDASSNEIRNSLDSLIKSSNSSAKFSDMNKPVTPSQGYQIDCEYKMMWNPTGQIDKELHYASLDLSEDGKETNISTSSSCENSAFTYAQIDFGKSEGLRTVSSSNSVNRKVLH